jgi:hypothetical protein
MYEKSSLELIYANFISLLQKNPKEEDLQKFIEANPVLLHQYPAKRLFTKPRILTRYTADFAILTPTKELVLIEIEKAETSIATRSGSMASGLSHAIDQVKDWIIVADEHRLALLDSLNIRKEDVSKIYGVVIAGRDSSCEAHNLRKIKCGNWGNVTVQTFDDLLYSLSALIKSFAIQG